jgi:hypothetical protein
MGSPESTSRRVSVTEHGLLPFRRELICSIDLAIPYQEVARAARVCLGDLVTDVAGSDARSLGHPETVVSTRHWSRVLRVTVEPEISHAYQRRPGVLAHLHWHAIRLPWLFPAMEADLLARPLGRRTELVLEAKYQPPGGILGVVGDVLVGRLVARSTAEVFTSRLAHVMEQAVTEGRCGTSATDHPRGKAGQ